MALQQVVPVSILLQGDGSSTTYEFGLGNLYQISSGSAVPYGNLGVIPTSVVASQPPTPVSSITIDGSGNITLTLVSPLGAGVVANFVLNLMFTSNDQTEFPTAIPVAVISGTISVSNFPSSFAVNLRDGSGNPILSTGGSLNIVGAVAVSNFPATQPVSGTVAVSNFPATQPVSGTVTANAGTGTFTVGGTVAVSNFPATQPVSGTIAATQSGAWSVSVSNFPATQPVSGTISVSNFPASQVVTLASTTITGTVAVTQSTSPWVISGTISVSNLPALQAVNLTQLNSIALGSPSNYGTSPGAIAVQGVNAFITNTPAVTLASTTITGSVAVTGTFFQATQPVSGTVAVSNFPATQPVSGTITANQGTSPWVVSLASTTITGTVAVTQSTSPWIVSLASTTITGTVAVNGALTNNNAAPTATLIGVLGAIAETAYATVTYTTGDMVLPVTDLHGALNHDLQAVAGTAVVVAAAGVQKVGIVGNAGATLDGPIGGAAPTNAVWNTPAPSIAAAGACSTFATASLTVVNVKASAGTVYGLSVNNTSSTPVYIQFYNTAGTPTLGTSVIFFVACFIGITVIPISPFAMAAFSTGIGIGASTSALSTGAPSVPPAVTVFFK